MAELFVYFLPTGGWWELFAILFIVQFILILFSNLAVIVTFLWDREMKTPKNMYIFSLSVADILMSACAAVYARMLFFTPEQYENDKSVCKWANIWFIAGFNFLSGIFTMIAIAADRYRAIVHWSKPKFGNRYTAVALCIIWIVAFCYLVSPYVIEEVAGVDLPVLADITNETDPAIVHLVHKPYNYSNEYIFYCSVSANDEAALTFTIIIFFCGYVLPLLIMSGLYGKIIYDLWCSSSEAVMVLPKESVDRKKRAVRMMVTILIMFAVAYLPMYVVQMLRTKNLGKTTPEQDLQLGIALNAAYTLIFCNTWANVVVYSFYNETFRKSFKKLMWRCSGPARAGIRKYSTTTSSKFESQNTTKTSVGQATRTSQGSSSSLDGLSKVQSSIKLQPFRNDNQVAPSAVVSTVEDEVFSKEQ